MLNLIVGLVAGIIVTLIILKINQKKEQPEPLEDQNPKINLEYEVRSLSQTIGGLESTLFLKQEELGQTKEQLEITKNQLNSEIERNKVILSAKKSGEVKLGAIAEVLSPFLIEGHDPKRLRHLGMPIDYLAFENDGIYFIEIKSGKSKLSPTQKHIKNLIMSKKVYFEEFRIAGKKIVKDTDDDKKEKEQQRRSNQNSQ